MTFLEKVSAYVKKHGVTEGGLGEVSVGKNYIFSQMRQGYCNDRFTINRIKQFMDENPKGFYDYHAEKFNEKQRNKYPIRTKKQALSEPKRRIRVCFKCGAKYEDVCDHKGDKTMADSEHKNWQKETAIRKYNGELDRCLAEGIPYSKKSLAMKAANYVGCSSNQVIAWVEGK